MLDIGPDATHPLGRLLGFYDPTPKLLPDGRAFRMYGGYYYYLIAEGEHSRFLRAKARRELLAKRQYRYQAVPDLTQHLADALTFNLNRGDLAMAMIQQSVDHVDWVKTGALSPAEKRWLGVVQSTLDHLRQ